MRELVAFMIGACIVMVIYDFVLIALLIWDKLVNG